MSHQTSPASSEGDTADHDEMDFDPKGTLTLILIYFVLLVLLWIHMYFIEFLGNDLVVIG